jgi:hypothetical protein
MIARYGNALSRRSVVLVVLIIFGARAASFAKSGSTSSNHIVDYRAHDSAGDSASDKKQALKPYALIFGTVYGPDQRPVSGITVKIRRAGDKKPKWERLSDTHGEFAVRVPAGAADYEVWAQLKGRQASENTEFKVHVDNDERRDVSIHLK